MAGRRLVLGFVGVILLLPAVARAQSPMPEGMTARVQAADQQPVGPGPAVADPRLLKEVRPRYTSEAMRAKIEGQVQLEIVILKDGTVGDVRVTKSLDATNGLDNEAVRAARGWLFQPARLKATGEPVDYRATLELAFRIFQNDDAFASAFREDTPNLVPAKALTTPQPNYSPEARAAGIEGQVVVEVVVKQDGSVAEARIKRSLDNRPSTTVEVAGRTLLQSQNLDDEALLAARQWKFEPATLLGKPVDAIQTLLFEFKLK